MTTSYPLSLALPGSHMARRWPGVLASAVGLLVVLAAGARTTLRAFGSGVVSLTAAVFGSRNCP